MRIAIPVTTDSMISRAFGKAQHMGVADVTDGVVASWDVHDVAWDVSHDEGSHGAHHARIVRFMKDHEIDRVVFAHMGEPMMNTLSKLGVTLLQVEKGEAEPLVKAASRIKVD